MSDSQGMDISQQRRMWHNFTRLMLATVVGTATILVLMAIILV